MIDTIFFFLQSKQNESLSLLPCFKTNWQRKDDTFKFQKIKVKEFFDFLWNATDVLLKEKHPHLLWNSLCFAFQWNVGGVQV